MKRTIYILLTMVLGLLLSFLAHAVIEMLYLQWAQAHNHTIVWTTVLGLCALPLWLQIALPVVGLVGGFLLGRMWWTMVYVNRKHWLGHKV